MIYARKGLIINIEKRVSAELSAKHLHMCVELRYITHKHTHTKKELATKRNFPLHIVANPSKALVLGIE